MFNLLPKPSPDNHYILCFCEFTDFLRFHMYNEAAPVSQSWLNDNTYYDVLWVHPCFRNDRTSLFFKGWVVFYYVPMPSLFTCWYTFRMTTMNTTWHSRGDFTLRLSPPCDTQQYELGLLQPSFTSSFSTLPSPATPPPLAPLPFLVVGPCTWHRHFYLYTLVCI